MTRDEILRRFEEWLDHALAEEAPPEGIDAEILSPFEENGVDGRCDSYRLWEAMTALSQEVKLQGRAFRELNDTISSQAGDSQAGAGQLAEELRGAYREREREARREAERRCRKEILGALLDLRDRLGRGLESARTGAAEIAVAARASWLTRLIHLLDRNPDQDAAAMVAALRRGYELGLERLDQTLEEFNAREIRCQGQPFDPRSMNAIDKEASSAVPEGTVMEVYRSGYIWNGEVFRTAQVKVSSPPAEAERK